MKMNLIFQKTETDYMTAWVDTRTIVVDIPDEFKEHHKSAVI